MAATRQAFPRALAETERLGLGVGYHSERAQHVASVSEALVAQKGPFAVELRAGKTYAWCACGRSASQPFCDGSHKDTGFAPVVFKAEQDGTVYLCGCKTSQGRPFCDGSHNRL